MQQQSTNQWSSQTAFVFAAAAAAVGLGNIWRFPYLTGEHGGGAFVLVYLFFMIVLGIPLMLSEALIGRIGKGNPVYAIRSMAQKIQRSKHWQWIGAASVLTSFLILTYYCVITGWVLDYFGTSVFNLFTGITHLTLSQDFSVLQQNALRMLCVATLVIAANVFVISFGIKRGLERAVMLLFPAFIILLFILFGYSLFSGGMRQTVTFLFQPNFHALTPEVILIALGQAFLSLSIGMGITMTFSAFLPKHVSLTKCIVVVALTDTWVALMSGLVIFPFVFSHHMTPAAGPSLIFQTLPVAFMDIPFGHIAASLFFLLLFFAAFTSTLSMLEVAVAWLKETHGFKQSTAAIISGCAIWVVSIGSILSFTHPHLLNIAGKTFFDILDYVTSGFLLPIGGFFIAIFSGWLIPKYLIREKLGWETTGKWFLTWQFIQRYLAPIAILFIFLTSVGIF